MHSDLQRVRNTISATIIKFVDEVSCTESKTFYGKELETYVANVHPGAPASPCRVLRDLRQSGKVNYEVVSRSKSLYQIL